MKELKSHNTVPHGGEYITTDRQTGMKIVGYNFGALLEVATRQRRANGIPVGLDFERELESWVCEDYPEECNELDPRIPKRQNELRFNDMLRGTQVMMAHVANGMKVVDRGEAERRAAICSGCRFNTPFNHPCGGLCGALLEMVKTITGAQGTAQDMHLKACSICHCLNQAQIWIPLEILDKGLTDDMRAQFETVPHCWKRKDTTCQTTIH